MTFKDKRCPQCGETKPLTLKHYWHVPTRQKVDR